VFCVELFETPSGFIANEIAPRVHNSGHWTSEACTVSQFEHHMRAVAGWPLAPVNQHSKAVMTNLIGHDVDAWQSLATQGGLELYGKRSVRPGRKMGHRTEILTK
jgi:5-(carboxyamino)imidazole ribonucleotide synthase